MSDERLDETVDVASPDPEADAVCDGVVLDS